jgi:hypothetical protein
MPLESSCGQDCREAIDAAAAFVAHVHASIGDGAEAADIIETASLVCEVYWRG